MNLRPVRGGCKTKKEIRAEPPAIYPSLSTTRASSASRRSRLGNELFTTDHRHLLKAAWYTFSSNFRTSAAAFPSRLFVLPPPTSPPADICFVLAACSQTLKYGRHYVGKANLASPVVTSPIYSQRVGRFFKNRTHSLIRSFIKCIMARGYAVHPSESVGRPLQQRARVYK